MPTKLQSSFHSNALFLSDEVLLHIFKHLAAFELRNCRLVCRRWNSLLNSDWFWRYLLLNEFEHGNVRKFLAISKSFLPLKETLKNDQLFRSRPIVSNTCIEISSDSESAARSPDESYEFHPFVQKVSKFLAHCRSRQSQVFVEKSKRYALVKLPTYCRELFDFLMPPIIFSSSIKPVLLDEDFEVVESKSLCFYGYGSLVTNYAPGARFIFIDDYYHSSVRVVFPKLAQKFKIRMEIWHLSMEENEQIADSLLDEISVNLKPFIDWNCFVTDCELSLLALAIKCHSNIKVIEHLLRAGTKTGNDAQIFALINRNFDAFCLLTS